MNLIVLTYKSIYRAAPHDGAGVIAFCPSKIIKMAILHYTARWISGVHKHCYQVTTRITDCDTIDNEVPLCGSEVLPNDRGAIAGRSRKSTSRATARTRSDLRAELQIITTRIARSYICWRSRGPGWNCQRWIFVSLSCGILCSPQRINPIDSFYAPDSLSSDRCVISDVMSVLRESG